MNKKLIIILAIVLAVLVAVFTIVFFATRPETSLEKKDFTLVVTHGDGTKEFFDITTHARYLGDALVKEGIISGDESEFGLYVKYVDGERADYALDDGAYWKLSVGGEDAQTGVDSVPVEDGQVYGFAYTK